MGVRCLLQGDNGQNFTLPLGGFFSPVKYSLSFRLIFVMP